MFILIEIFSFSNFKIFSKIHLTAFLKVVNYWLVTNCLTNISNAKQQNNLFIIKPPLQARFVIGKASFLFTKRHFNGNFKTSRY